MGVWDSAGFEPEEPMRVGRPMAEEMRGADGWFCRASGRRLGRAVRPPDWYMRPESGATAHGVQVGATCGLHAVNHCLRSLGPEGFFTSQVFDAKASAADRRRGGNWLDTVLRANLAERGAAMHEVMGADHQDLPRWSQHSKRLMLWAEGVRGCVVHTPGHWLALVPPDGQAAENNAALLCDSLHPRPFSLTAEEVGDFFALVASRHLGAANAADAGEYSIYVVEERGQE